MAREQDPVLEYEKYPISQKELNECLKNHSVIEDGGKYYDALTYIEYYVEKKDD